VGRSTGWVAAAAASWARTSCPRRRLAVVGVLGHWPRRRRQGDAWARDPGNDLVHAPDVVGVDAVPAAIRQHECPIVVSGLSDEPSHDWGAGDHARGVPVDDPHLVTHQVLRGRWTWCQFATCRPALEAAASKKDAASRSPTKIARRSGWGGVREASPVSRDRSTRTRLNGIAPVDDDAVDRLRALPGNRSKRELACLRSRDHGGLT